MNDSSKIDTYCTENGFVGWYETSAKEDINIERAAKRLVEKVRHCDLTFIGSGTLGVVKLRFC